MPIESNYGGTRLIEWRLVCSERLSIYFRIRACARRFSEYRRIWRFHASLAVDGHGEYTGCQMVRVGRIFRSDARQIR